MELGMKPKKFWKLEFYEWTQWLHSIALKMRRRREDQELLIELERNSMALLANVNRGKNSPTYTGKDFYTLPYDKVVVENNTAMTGEQLYEFFNNRFKNKPVRTTKKKK